MPPTPAPLLAMIALDQPDLPAPADFLAEFEQLSCLRVDPATLALKQQTFVFPLAKDHAVVGLMPAPIPWSNLEGPCATAWWWPQATVQMRGHRAHLLLALTGGSDGILPRHILLTQLTAAVARVTEPVGIYWGGGSLVHEPEAFQTEVAELVQTDPPLHLWIDFRVERLDGGAVQLFTTGMKAFGQMEIEVPPCEKSPAAVFDFARTIASYLIVAGANIRDGHTVGRSDDEQVAARHAPSMWNPEIKVLRLEF